MLPNEVIKQNSAFVLRPKVSSELLVIGIVGLSFTFGAELSDPVEISKRDHVDRDV